jgi:hypothetical protein
MLTGPPMGGIRAFPLLDAAEEVEECEACAKPRAPRRTWDPRLSREEASRRRRVADT